MIEREMILKDKSLTKNTYEKFLKKSKWHKNWDSKKSYPNFARILCRIKGKWDSNIKINKERKESNVLSNVQTERYGFKYKERYVEGFMDKTHKKYQPIIDCLGLGNTRTFIHVQHPGQMHVIHMDTVYGGGHWDYLGKDRNKKVCRVMIYLDDWKPGQVVLMGSEHFYKWKKGDVLWFKWQDIPHGTVNFGHHDRPLLFVTGEITEKFKKLLKAKRPKVIKI